MFDDLVRAYPGSAAAVILLLVGMLHGALQILMRRVDQDVKENAREIAALKVEVAAQKTDLKVWRAVTEGHLKDEEKNVWPQIRQILEEAKERSRIDAQAHATILERMTNIAQDHGEKIAALEALVRNGRKGE